MDTLITVADAARRLGVNRQRIDQLIRAGRLPAQHYGRIRLLPAAAVETYEPLPAGWQAGKPRKTHKNKGKAGRKNIPKKS